MNLQRCLWPVEAPYDTEKLNRKLIFHPHCLPFILHHCLHWFVRCFLLLLTCISLVALFPLHFSLPHVPQIYGHNNYSHTWYYNAGHKCWETYQNTSEQSPPSPSPSSPPPPSNVEFWWSNAHLYKKNYLPTFVNIVLGGGGRGRGDYAQIVLLKITIVVPNDSLVILDGFHKCPNYFWPPLSESDYVKEIMFVVYFCTKKGALVGIILS